MLLAQTAAFQSNSPSLVAPAAPSPVRAPAPATAQHPERPSSSSISSCIHPASAPPVPTPLSSPAAHVAPAPLHAMDTYAEREGWRQAYPAPISSGGSDRLVSDDWARAPEARSSSHSERGPTQSTSRPQLPSQQTARSPSPPFQSRPASVSTPSYAHSPFPSSTPAPAPSDDAFYAKRAGQPLTFGSLEQSAGVARSLMPGKNEAALGYDSLLGPHPTSSSSSSGAPDGFQYGRPSAREQDRERAVTPQSGGSESGHSVRSRSSNTDRWRREGMYGQGAEGLPDLPYQRQPPFEQHTSSTSTTTIQPAGSYFPADNPTGEERDRSSSRLRFPAAASTTTPTASSLLLSPLSPLVAPFSPASGSSSNGSLNWGPAAKGPSNGLSSERGLPTSPLDLRSYPLHAQQQQQQQQQLLYEQQEQQRDRDEEDQYRQQQHFEQMERREFDDHQQTPNAQRTQYSALPPMGKYPNIASLGLTDHGAALPHPSDVAASHAYHHHQQQSAYEYGDVPSSSWSATMSANGSREGLRREYRATNGSNLGEMAAARSAGMMGPGANNSGGGSQAGGGSSVEGAEEISTIFVVGFPDDMLEREFQNMFVFSVGFEAATLKIPAGSGLKDSKGGSDRPSTATGSHGDPYAGMLGQDGSAAYDDGFANQPLDSASSPATLVHVHALAIAATRSTAGSPSSRKQIIGFAKFRTRAQALDARDVLSGRKVDAEKGSMLKAEMAKKNLHTKRGISNELAGGVSMNSLDPATLDRLANTSTLNPAVLAELARQNAIAQHISATPTPQTMSNGLQSTAAFDAFHSVPQQHSAPPPRRDRELSGASTANFPLSGALSTRSARDRHSAQSEPYHDEPYTSPVPASAAYYSLPRQQSEMASPPLQHQRAFPGPPHPQQLKERGMSAEEYAEEMGETSPRMRNSMLQGQGGWSGKSMMQQLDEGTELAMDMEREREARSQQHLYLQQQAHFQNHPPPPLPQNYGERPQHDPYRQAQQFPPPSLHSPPNEHSYLADDRYHQSLFVQQQAMARPGPSSLPMGPAISANSIPRTQNPADMNAPKNTLYVGGLPAVLPSLTGPFSAAHLEDSLRNAFSRCPGFRRLCFRAKSNTIITLVEFVDTSFATRALQEMYGNQLGGLVKGGIRLSYSKNPLGVRAGSVSNASGSPGPLSPPPLSSENIFTSSLYNASTPRQDRRPTENFMPTQDYRAVGMGMGGQPIGTGPGSYGAPGGSFSPFGYEH